MRVHRAYVWVLAVVLTLPVAFAASKTYDPAWYPSVTEQLVEGHTVFAVINATICIKRAPGGGKAEAVDCPVVGPLFNNATDLEARVNMTLQRMGAAVAVLVRDRSKELRPEPVPPRCATNRDVAVSVLLENPGVLWFNDQFLVGDDLDIVETDVDANVDVCSRSSLFGFAPSENWRFPCGGWIVATQGGNPDPRTFLGAPWQYVETYHIVDPNDHVWDIHKWQFFSPIAIGVIPSFSDAESVPMPDGGTLDTQVSVQSSYGYHLSLYNMWSVPVQGTGACMQVGAKDVGPTSGQSSTPFTDTASRAPPYDTFYTDPDGSGPKHLEQVKYNAVLFFFFEDLVPNGVKDHGNGGGDDGDLSFCAAGSNEWDCGVGRTDADEGNSHPYNDAEPSAPGEPASGPRHLHPTADVDLYFSNDPPPKPAIVHYAVYDTVGSSAPRHTHADGEAFDDRIRFDAAASACWYFENVTTGCAP